jgi:UDP-N-acetylmuramoyl-L-alanyl-D-glutamate--2,6-diaminopimelate ligase
LRLGDLIGDGPATGGLGPARDVEIAGLTSDSRRVEAGYLFAALPGARVDGRQFIAEAIGRGASAVLAPPGAAPQAVDSVAIVTDGNPRRRYALMAARYYGVQPAFVAAVTGTNGKTSVAAFLSQLWARTGHKAASMGTLGIRVPGVEGTVGSATSLTTPDPVDLHRSLRDLARSGIDRVAMEASSHGLAQHRLDGVRIAAAAFTNLTRDHLDYHGTMEAYLAAKLRLFSELLPAGASAVVRLGAPGADAVLSAARARGHAVLTYGERGAAVALVDSTPSGQGQHVALDVMGRRLAATLPMVGAFQAENALAALALALAVGGEPDALVAALAVLEPPRGRLERVGRHPCGAAIFVDYAHTPDALATVLKAVAAHAGGALHLVFGCGGDRDAGKRPQMGRIAAAMADFVIVTDDNPRGEDPAAIRADVLAGCPGALEIGDRAEAIAVAVRALKPGDALVVAGKGHEQGQIVGGTVRPFDDRDAVLDALARLSRERASA